MDGNCQACDSYRPLDHCHIKSKGSGGGMESGNLLFMCRECHRFQHSVGWPRFIKHRPRIKKVLSAKGWQIVNEFGVKRLRKRQASEKS